MLRWGVASRYSDRRLSFVDRSFSAGYSRFSGPVPIAQLPHRGGVSLRGITMNRTLHFLLYVAFVAWVCTALAVDIDSQTLIQLSLLSASDAQDDIDDDADRGWSTGAESCSAQVFGISAVSQPLDFSNSLVATDLIFMNSRLLI